MRRLWGSGPQPHKRAADSRQPAGSKTSLLTKCVCDGETESAPEEEIFVACDSLAEEEYLYLFFSLGTQYHQHSHSLLWVFLYRDTWFTNVKWRPWPTQQTTMNQRQQRRSLLCHCILYLYAPELRSLYRVLDLARGVWYGHEPNKPIFIIILNTLFVALIVVFVSLISLLFCVFCFVCFSSHLAAAKAAQAAKYSEDLVTWQLFKGKKGVFIKNKRSIK